MAKFTQLEIHGYRGPVSNYLIQQEETTHLALILPGYGYRVDAPLLYFSGLHMNRIGADVLHLDTRYDQDDNYHQASSETRAAWLAADAGSALDAAFAVRDYDRLTLVGKSLGTRVMGYLISQDPRCAGADCIWFTPLLTDELLLSQIVSARPRSLFVIGSADHFYDSCFLRQVEVATGGQSLVIEDGDHSLLVSGQSALDAIEVLRQVIEAVERFKGPAT